MLVGDGIPFGAIRTLSPKERKLAKLCQVPLFLAADFWTLLLTMETLAIVFIVLLLMILLWIMCYVLVMWKKACDQAGKETEDVRKATAESMVTYTHDRMSRTKRATLPVHSAAIQKNWRGKRMAGIPPSHKTVGKRIIRPGEEYAAGSPIEESPIAEEIPVPEAAADPSPHPRSRPHFSPGMYRKRSGSEPREVAIDVYGAGGPSGVPMQAIPEVIETPPPVRRATSMGNLAGASRPPSKYLTGTPPRRTQSLRGSQQPVEGQLPRRRPSQGSLPTSSASSGRRGSSEAVSVEPKTGSAGYSRLS